MQLQKLRFRASLIVGVAAITLGCVGEIVEHSGPGAGAGSPGGDLGPAATDPAALVCDAAEPDPGPALIRRLNHREYDNSLRDLLGDTSRPAQAFGGDSEGLGYTTNSQAQTVTATLVTHYADAALAVAKAAEGRWTELVACDPAVIGALPCAREWIASFGLKAYRRPLDTAEVDRLATLFEQGRSASSGSFGAGVRWVLQAMLQSPHFLYRVELGQPSSGSGSRVPLTAYELATRLSYFVWATTPDSALLEAAASGKLESVEDVEAQVVRMVADPKARDSERAFHEEWAGLSHLLGVQRDELTATIAAAMVEESLRFAAWAFWEAGSLQDFYTAPVSFRNAELSTFLGEPGASSSIFERVDLDPARRAGFLTQPSVSTLHAKKSKTAPVHRGRFVLERVLCDTLPDPPDNVDTTIPDAAPGQTLREQMAQHSADPACRACHEKVDPIGFAFEHYDWVGRWRDDDNGSPVDASVTLVGTDVDGQLVGAPALAARFAESPQVALCMATQWYRYGIGRQETAGDDCHRKHIYDRFVASNHKLQTLLSAIATSDAFRYRRVSQGQP